MQCGNLDPEKNLVIRPLLLIMVNLDSTISLDVQRFWRWWTAELSFLVPSWYRDLIKPKKDFLILTKNEDLIELVHCSTGGDQNLGTFTLDSEGRQKAEDSVFSEQPALTEMDTIFRLSPEHCLRKVFKLPAAARENLRKVVAFEMDRRTPFSMDQVYYDVRVVEALPDANQISVEMAVIQRTTLDEQLEKLSEWGLRPTIVDMPQIGEGTELSRSRFNLLPDALKSKKRNFEKMLNISLMVFLPVLLLVILIIPIWLNYSYLNELRQEVAAVSKIANEVQTLKKKADDGLRELDFLLEKKRSEPVLVETLEELTKLIPNDSWLTNLQYKDRRLQIQGQSPGASLLIEKLELSLFFQNTSFVSPVTQDRRTGFERFQIATNVINGRMSEKTVNPES